MSDAAYATIINGPHLQNLVLGMRTNEKIKGKREVMWSVEMFILETVMISISKGANQLALVLYP